MSGDCLLRLLTIGAVVAVMTGCGEAEPSLQDRPEGRNLVENSSFETNGQPTLEGWQVQNRSLTSLVEEAPPGGGQWSLKLEADWAPPTGYVAALIPDAQDGDTFQLSAYARATSPSGGAAVGLVVGKSFEYSERRDESFTSTTDVEWRQLSVVETLSLREGEYAWVVLSAPPTEVAPRSGLFDLVTVERLKER
jgi:hypothetical protein